MTCSLLGYVHAYESLCDIASYIVKIQFTRY